MDDQIIGQLQTRIDQLETQVERLVLVQTNLARRMADARILPRAILRATLEDCIGTLDPDNTPLDGWWAHLVQSQASP